MRENDQAEFYIFRRAAGEVENRADFVIIDTPGFDINLTRLAYSLADTLVTPVNNSLIDLNVVAQIDPVTSKPRKMSHYARLVQRARSERLSIDERTIDWVLCATTSRCWVYAICGGSRLCSSASRCGWGVGWQTALPSG